MQDEQDADQTILFRSAVDILTCWAVGRPGTHYP